MKLYHILISIPFVLLLIYSLRKTYRVRQYVETEKHVKLVFENKNTVLSWVIIINFLILSYLVLTNIKDEVELFFLTILFITLFLQKVIELIIAYKSQGNRIILKKDELIYLSNFLIKLDIHKITKISLNGFTSQLRIKGKRSIYINIHDLEDENLLQLLHYFKDNVDLSTVKMSDNLKHLI